MRTVRLQEASYDKEEILAINEVLDSTFVVMGKRVSQFEQTWSEKYNYLKSTMVNSGSSANLLMVSLLMSKRGSYQLMPGDEVLVPALTWSTTIFPVIQMGLKPILVDIDPKTFNLDLQSCKRALSKKTKALFAVHLLGNPCNMDKLSHFCKENKLILIEDACEALGSQWDKQFVGSFGEFASFSFMFAHHLSTIEGGMVSFKSEENYRIATATRAHGWIRGFSEEDRRQVLNDSDLEDDRFLFWDTGFNLRPSEIQGAMGQAQLNKVDKFIEIRDRNFDIYKEHLQPISDKIQIQELEDNDKAKMSNYGFGFYIKESKFKRYELMSFLQENLIESRPIMAGNLARHPFYELYCDAPVVSLENSDILHKNGMYVPNHQSLKQEDVLRICDVIKMFFQK